MRFPVETLTAGELELRRWRAGDAGQLHRSVNASIDHLKAWLPWVADGYSEADAGEYLKNAAEEWDDGATFDYKILCDGVLAGGCGIMVRGPAKREIGYWLEAGHTGRGLMTRVVTLLVDEAFRTGADRIEIRHDQMNVRSGAIPRKLGFTEVDLRRADDPGGFACNGVHIVWELRKPQP